MKRRSPLFRYVSGLILMISVQARAYVNLDFESAILTPTPPGQFGGSVPIGLALPGWSGYLGTNRVANVLQNNLTLGNASIDILGPNWNFGGIIEGQYTLVLQPGVDPFGSGVTVGATVSQPGLVPSYAKSIQVKASVFSSFAVSLGGQSVDLIPIGSGPTYTLYAADISSFAGQALTLAVTALPAPNTTDYFDSIVFSASPVPEPSVVGLLALGALLFGVLCRFNCFKRQVVNAVRG